MFGLRAKAAVHAFEDKANSILEPLLEEGNGGEDSSSGSSSSGEDSEYSGPSTDSAIPVVKQTPMQIVKAATVYLTLLAGTAASVGAIIINPAIAVFVMAGVFVAHVPYSAYKEARIIKLPTLRSLNNKLREDANKLEEEVNGLSEQLELLQPEAERATVVEDQLRDIAAGQHKNVDKIVDLAKENEAILKQTRDNLRQRIVQDIIKIVMMSDKNNDGKFSKVETKFLVLKLGLQLGEYGVKFDEEKFYRVMAMDPTVIQTLGIVKRLIPSLNEDDEDDSIDEAEIGDEDTYDMFHIVDDGSVAATSFSGSLSTTGLLSIDAEPRTMSLSLSQESPKSKRTDNDTISLSLSQESPRSKKAGMNDSPNAKRTCDS